MPHPPVNPALLKPPPTMFFQLATGAIVNLWQIVRAEDTSDGNGLHLRFADDTGIDLTGPDAISVAEVLHTFSVRARTPEDGEPQP